MDKLELSGMETLSKECQAKAEQTMKDFKDIFALEPLELGRTNLVKHTIKVSNLVPFKERYRRIQATSVREGKETSKGNGGNRSHMKIKQPLGEPSSPCQKEGWEPTLLY